VDTRKNPNEEQLAHVLESTPNEDPEKNEAAFIFKFVCLNMYMFMLTTTPYNTAVIVARINPGTASSGK
jgi:hypothetical protein